MNSECIRFIKHIIGNSAKHDKQAVINDVQERFSLIKDRTVYHNNYFAVRFSYSKSNSASFSNTILSLSKLEKYDRIPFFVVLVRRETDNMILLANTTFLRKISHSSQTLSMNNIKGSFNGSDIMREYDGITNAPENFDYLFNIHQGLEWTDNLLRLVEASSRIKPVSLKFKPSEEERKNIMESVERAAAFASTDNFKALKDDLDTRCNQCQNEILIASHIENTNIRGRLIETLITSNESDRAKIIQNLHDIESALPAYDTRNGLGDYFVEFDNGDTYTDIKTKVVYLSSHPKAYNIDKFLRQMADIRSIFLFYFIGIDERSVFNTLLCSVYHSQLIDKTILQRHWAGRSTRGVAQFDGTVIDKMLNETNFRNCIEKDKCTAFLTSLLDR